MELHDPLGRPGAPGSGSRSDATSVHGPNLRREKSMRNREFGLYASRVQNPSPSNSNPTSPTSPASTEAPRMHGEGQLDLHGERSPPLPTSHIPSSLTSQNRNFSRPDSSTNEEPAAGDEFAPRMHSPRWDSLVNSTTIVYNQAEPTVPNPYSPTAVSSPGPLPSFDEELDTVNSLPSDIRDDLDDFPRLSSHAKMTSIESRHGSLGEPATTVDNFSRPRKASVKQSVLPEIPRSRAQNTFSSQSEPPGHLEMGSHQQQPRPRDRGQSTSSNQSAATFSSVPVRSPPVSDLPLRDYARGRSRQGNTPVSRTYLLYNRAESSGQSSARDPLPRMASAPSDELRASYRSHLSTSTGPRTSQTERSSVMTKTSSVTSTSQYEAADDAFSVDDLMGMYERGFRDDSPAPPNARKEDEEDEDEESRPPTATSEIGRRRSAMLEAMSESLPIPKAEDSNLLAVPKTGPEIRASHAFFQFGDFSTGVKGSSDGLREHVLEIPVAQEAKTSSNEKLDETVETADYFPVSPRLLQQPMTFPEPEVDDSRDIYGFRKENQYITKDEYEAWNSGYSEYMARRRKKWLVYLRESGMMTENPDRFPAHSAKTKRFIRKGIPPEWRGAAWFYYAGGPAIIAKHVGVYDELVSRKAKETDVELIERDLHRTFPDNIKFRSGRPDSSVRNSGPEGTRTSQQTLKESPAEQQEDEETPMISALRRVLHAFSIFNPRIGYCQSLNFLAGLLLLFVETEEQAFWLLNVITRVFLPGTHELSLEGANVDLGVLMAALRESMPGVWAKIGGELDGTDAPKRSRRTKKGADHGARLPPITLCMTAWFMSCFIGTLPIETTLRVWDIFFYEGSKTLFRIALAIFKIGEPEIRAVGDPMEIFQVVQTIPRKMIDANGLMDACFKRRNGFGHLSQDTIDERRQERRKANKKERADQTLPVSNASDEAVVEVRRKGTIFGRRERRRPAEVI